MSRKARTILISILAAAVLSTAACSDGKPAAAGGAPTGDLSIPKKKVSARATFYPVSAGGVTVEVLAVRAPDGSIRTALNTCQVCYSSGRGYYTQQGDFLVCANCGNRFHISQVERIKGGCNPVPISPEFKSETEESIVIPGDLLQEAAVLFLNWKK